MQFDLVVYSFVVSRASFSLRSAPPLEGKVSIPTAVLSTNASRAGNLIPQKGAAAVELEFWKSVGALLPSLPSRR